MDSKFFNSMEIDAIGEILNISLGASATAVSTLLGKRVDITTPDVKVASFDEFNYEELEPAVGVEITYVSGLSGSNIMLLKRNDVRLIVGLLMGIDMPEEEFELNEINMSAVCEVMNQMMGASSTALSEFLNDVVNISTPKAFEVVEVNKFKEKCFNGQENMVVVDFQLKIEDMVESRFMNLMPINLAKKLISSFGLSDYAVEEQAPEPQPEIQAEPSSSKMLSQEEIEKLISGDTPPEPPKPESSSKTLSQEEIEKLISGNTQSAPPPQPESSSKQLSQEEIEKLVNGSAAQTPPPPQPQPMPQPIPPQPQPMPMPDGAGMYYGQMPYMNPMYAVPPPQPAAPKMINAQPLNPQQFVAPESMGEEQAENLALIMDVPLEISVEIGRTKRMIKEILEFSEGSLIVLDKLAGDQVDIYANGQCIAKGDVVVVDDSFGVRITEIVKRPDIFNTNKNNV